jgi:hypothetical protein
MKQYETLTSVRCTHRYQKQVCNPKFIISTPGSQRRAILYFYLLFEKHDDVFQVLQQPTSPHTQTLAQSTIIGSFKKIKSTRCIIWWLKDGQRLWPRITEIRRRVTIMFPRLRISRGGTAVTWWLITQNFYQQGIYKGSYHEWQMPRMWWKLCGKVGVQQYN